MQENPTLDDNGPEASSAPDAVAAFLSASDAALASARALDAAWRQHLRSAGPEPAADWIVEVAAQQVTSASALARALQATQQPVLAGALAGARVSDFGEVTSIRVKRRRRRENKLLVGISPGGLRVLRACLLLLLLVSILMATGAGISLSLEAAGFLHLIDDPVQLPVASQLGIFLLFAASAFAMRRLLKPVERALYGTKTVRPKLFQL
jgi:hypothetical protein